MGFGKNGQAACLPLRMARSVPTESNSSNKFSTSKLISFFNEKFGKMHFEMTFVISHIHPGMIRVEMLEKQMIGPHFPNILRFNWVKTSVDSC